MKFPRRSGVLLHPTSLPGPYGIGDFGAQAYAFVDWLAAAEQSYWQVLPLSPTGYADSPYQGLSAFAGNPMLISPDNLLAQGHLEPADLENVPAFPVESIDYGWVISWKTDLLNRAYQNFTTGASASERTAFAAFEQAEASWLEDASLFLALKENHNRTAWYDWEPDIRARKPEALAAARAELADQILRQKYFQWQFYQQWLAVKNYANHKGIDIIVDIPIYVARDCCDVWANPGLFELDEDLNPTVVSGVPPDYFSLDGQLWGHPLYRWDVMAKQGYAWWIARFATAFTVGDVTRIDHFRAFYNYWEIPANAQTARSGRWRYGASGDLFEKVNEALGDVRIIAEDLGDFDKESRAGLDALLTRFGFPGMKIIEFAFGGTAEAAFLPHNYTREWVVYTGTHDNDTVVGWWDSASQAERKFTKKYLHIDGNDIAWDLMRAAWMSVANTALTTTQDILRLGHQARMNLPGVSGPPNWCWRMAPGALTPQLAAELQDMTATYGRIIPPPVTEPIEPLPTS